LRLEFRNPAGDLLQEIVHADAVLLGLFEPPQRFGLAGQELVDPGRLFEQSAAIGRLGRENRVDLALRDDRVRPWTQARPHQQFDHVAQTHALAIDVELALARAIGATGDLHFARVDLQRAVGVVESQRHLGHAERLAPLVAGEDDVLGLGRAQRFRALLAEYPTDRVDQVRLPGTVRTDQRRDAGFETERRLLRESLKAEQPQRLELHGRDLFDAALRFVCTAARTDRRRAGVAALAATALGAESTLDATSS
jgi:hypothetical protein